MKPPSRQPNATTITFVDDDDGDAPHRPDSAMSVATEDGGGGGGDDGGGDGVEASAGATETVNADAMAIMDELDDDDDL